MAVGIITDSDIMCPCRDFPMKVLTNNPAMSCFSTVVT